MPRFLPSFQYKLLNSTKNYFLFTVYIRQPMENAARSLFSEQIINISWSKQAVTLHKRCRTHQRGPPLDMKDAAHSYSSNLSITPWFIHLFASNRTTADKIKVLPLVRLIR